LTGRLDRLHHIWPPGGRLERPKWPALHQTTQKMPKPIGTPSKHSQVSKTCTNFSPLLTMHESRQNAKSFNIYLLKYTQFITRSNTSSNEQVIYSTGS
jgi:hypothetical protein